MENHKEEQLNRQGLTSSDPGRKGRYYSGIILVVAGVLFLLRQMDVFHAPWLFSWPVLLILIGLIVGAKEGFRPGGWLIPMIIGMVFFIQKFGTQYFQLDPQFLIQLNRYLWPLLIIGIGIFILMRPKKVYERSKWESSGTQENELDVVSIFGGVKRSILSKDFKGGEVVCVFGGAEINFSQTEIIGTAVLDITQIFGGAKIIVPAHWEVKSEAIAILGGIDDKRNTIFREGSSSTLVIKGVTIFGGLEIRSY